MATSKKEVAVVTQGELQFPDQAPEWAQNGTGRGNENVTTNDLVLPRLELVQAQSPIKDTNPDAKEGMLFNSATMEVIGDIAYIVPISFRVEYIVWKDQDEGGGFFGSFGSQGEAQSRVAELVSGGENPAFLEVVDTPVHYCLLIRPDMSSQQIVVSMPKSKAKVSRKWNAIISIAGGDRFARVYKFSSFKDKNKKNQTFFNFVVQPAGFTPQALFLQAEKMYEMFKTTAYTVDYASETIDSTGDSDI